MGTTSILCFFNYSGLRKVDQLDGLVAGCGSLAMLGTVDRPVVGDAEDLLG